MKYHPHLSFPGYGWLEPFSDADMPLIEEEFARDDKARERGAAHKPLGHDCDRAAWERVASLWRK